MTMDAFSPSTSRRRPRRTLVTAAVAAGLVLTACGADDQSPETPPSQESPADASSGDGPLAAVCPDPVVIQTGWFPQAEVGPLYTLIGPGGEIDATQGVYRGPLGDSGVTLEVRSGGPYLGEQSVAELMYQDPDILLGTLNLDVAIRSYGTLPTTGVMAFWNTHPLALTYDPANFSFDTISDIGKSDATVLYFTGTAFIDYLVGEGMIREDQLDDSFTGALDRIVAAPDEIVMHAVVTNEPWRLENEIDAWGRPVENLLVDDAGYRLYQSLSVRSELVDEEASCLQELIPLVQDAVREYLDSPDETHAVLGEIVAEFDTFWTMPEELLDHAYGEIRRLGVFEDEDGLIGPFDPERVQTLLDQLAPIYQEQGIGAYDPDVTVDDLTTNEFIQQSEEGSS